MTEVSGFVKNHPLVLNGKYAAIIWRSYTGELAERPHPGNTTVETETNPGGG